MPSTYPKQLLCSAASLLSKAFVNDFTFLQRVIADLGRSKYVRNDYKC